MKNLLPYGAASFKDASPSDVVHSIPGTMALDQGQMIKVSAGVALPKQDFTLRVPLNAFMLFRQLYPDVKLSATANTFHLSDSTEDLKALVKWPDYRSANRDSLYNEGKALLQRCAYLFKPGVVEYLTEYQVRHAGVLKRHPASIFTWPGGAGKTQGALAAGLAVLSAAKHTGTLRRGILVVGPDIAAHSWIRQTPQLLQNDKAFYVKAASYRRKKDQTLTHYLATSSCPILFIGYESLPTLWPEVKAAGFNPAGLILDELDLFSSSKRMSAQVNVATDSTTFAKRKTPTGQEARAAVIMDIAHGSNFCFRLGLTATPMTDGKLRNAWAQLDLLDPWNMGAYSIYKLRYTSAGTAAYGADTGSINVDEFSTRAAYYISEVKAEEARKLLPPTVYNIDWLDVSATDLRAMRVRRMTEDDIEPQNKAEWELAAVADGKKRHYMRYITTILKERKDAKVVVFLPRRYQVEIWANELREEIECSYNKENREPLPLPEVRWAHGEHSTEMRQSCIDWLVAAPTGVLVTTIHSMGRAFDGLQLATDMVFGVIPANPAQLQQALARFERMGKTHTTYVHMLLARNTKEEAFVMQLTAAIRNVQSVVSATELNAVYALLSDNGLSTATVQAAIQDLLKQTIPAGSGMFDDD